MCVSVLLIFNIKLFFGIKHISQIKRYGIQRQKNVCKYISFISLFKFQYNFKDGNACVTFHVSFCFHGHVKTQFSKTNYKSEIYKAMFMHILSMTFNKLNIVHSLVFCSVNACLSLIKIL